MVRVTRRWGESYEWEINAAGASYRQGWNDQLKGTGTLD